VSENPGVGYKAQQATAKCQSGEDNARA
jgi:hypothetical protein